MDKDDSKQEEVRATVLTIKQSGGMRCNQGTVLREVVRKDFFGEVIHKPSSA